MIRVDTSAAIVDTSVAILGETIGILRDKFGWDAYGLHFARLALLRMAKVVVPTETFKVTGDPDDSRILECVAAGGSDFIVTEDKNLLRLGVFRGVTIVRQRIFWIAGGADGKVLDLSSPPISSLPSAILKNV